MIRGMSGCHGNVFWQAVSPAEFVRGGLEDNKDEVCVSTPQRWGRERGEGEGKGENNQKANQGFLDASLATEQVSGV